MFKQIIPILFLVLIICALLSPIFIMQIRDNTKAAKNELKAIRKLLQINVAQISNKTITG